MKGQIGGRHTESLCNFCICGANECEWMRRLKPIEGWKAKLVPCDHGKTYHVLKCPQFKSMPPCEEEAHRPYKVENKNRIATKKRRVFEMCLYGLKNFCDGTPNPSAKGSQKLPPCKFFVGGKCTIFK